MFFSHSIVKSQWKTNLLQTKSHFIITSHKADTTLLTFNVLNFQIVARSLKFIFYELLLLFLHPSYIRIKL
jgi:hypothetical protein